MGAAAVLTDWLCSWRLVPVLEGAGWESGALALMRASCAKFWAAPWTWAGGRALPHFAAPSAVPAASSPAGRCRARSCRQHAMAAAPEATPADLYDDVFTITGVNPEGKKFDKGA